MSPAKKPQAAGVPSIDGLNFTLGELETVEELTGYPASTWEEAPSQFKLTRVMLYVLRLRKEPDLDMEDLRDLPVSELEAQMAPFAAGVTEAT